jgi:DtxR family Mn-dependent transcriptional regulator
LNPTATVENYIKEIYQISQKEGSDRVSVGLVAKRLRVVPGTATVMMKSLQQQNLVEYEPRVGVQLTDQGRSLALQMIRRHRLVELFLVKVLGLDWSEIHAEAEVIEHAISDRVLERLDAFLGRPTVDPHGDPIPSRSGEIAVERDLSLLECPLGEVQTISRVTDQNPDFLLFASDQKLTPGTELRVLKRYGDKGGIKIKIQGGEVMMDVSTASKILVRTETRI